LWREGDVNFGARSHSGAKDFLFDGRQTGTLFAAHDFAVGFADVILAFPSEDGRIDSGVAQL
jgi:hypothetical protein